MIKNVNVFIAAVRAMVGAPLLALAAHSAWATVPSDTSWAERMALSDMQRNPEPWQIDFRKTPKWNYTHGLMMTAYQRLYEKTGDERYADHIQAYADTCRRATASWRKRATTAC